MKMSFNPNYFVCLDKSDIDKKVKAFFKVQISGYEISTSQI